ncbi:MAG: hypothetical protein QF722_04305 [Candidatus Thalassarchaeaceae archaeon]|jgi:hypothetical protein|nr:hypothetical protein [Candidatus Thalassarchaeaceae archaeon]MDP6844756.1 hypothetical protein [Candidatus Thalassarchaeaceae archaeon]
MVSRRESADDSAQVHILEMITLFWLFFMTATFILQLKVPDPTSPASDGILDLAAEDAYDSLAGATALDDGNHSSMLVEMLATEDEDTTCQAMLDSLSASIRGNCWLAIDAGPLEPHGDTSEPEGRSLTIHHLVHENGHVWTVSLQVWHTGGGA